MQINIDPTGNYRLFGNTEHELMEACGLIPMWVREWSASPTQRTLKEYLSDAYGFGLYEMTGGQIDPETGIYSYPEDPELKPLMSIDTDEGVLYIYEYAIVAIPTVHGYFITRMD